MSRPTKLMNRNFFLLWQGNFVSKLGSQAFAIAMMFWLKHETGSATLMGLIMMLSMLPAVILSPVAGTLADQYSRRKIIILCDLLGGIPVLALGLLILFFPAMSDIILVYLFVVSLILGIVRTFFDPAISAAIPDIVPEDKVAAANSLEQSSEQISMFVGQGLGGYLFVLLGAPVLFIIDGITYLFSAFSESLIEIPQKLRPKKRNRKELFAEFKQDMIEGFQFVWHKSGMRGLVLAAAFLNFFLMPIVVLLPFYVEDVLGVSPAWYGYILASLGLGSLIGFVAAGAVTLGARVRGKSMIVALFMLSAGMALFSIVDSAAIACVLMGVVGILSGFFTIHVMSILQLATPTEIRGRVFGLLTTLTAGLIPIAMGLGGLVADLTGQNIPLIYASCGIATVAASAFFSFNKEFQDFLAFEAKVTSGDEPVLEDDAGPGSGDQDSSF